MYMYMYIYVIKQNRIWHILSAIEELFVIIISNFLARQIIDKSLMQKNSE